VREVVNYNKLYEIFPVSSSGYTAHAALGKANVFTAQCTLVQSAVLRSHVVCLSVCLSVCNVGEL